MECLFSKLGWVAGGLYRILRDWQTLWIGGVTLTLGWYQWELMALIPSLKDLISGTEMRLQEKEIDRIAKRLSNLPDWMARRVFKSAVHKFGRTVWAEDLKKFDEAIVAWKTNRRELRKNGFV